MSNYVINHIGVVNSNYTAPTVLNPAFNYFLSLIHASMIQNWAVEWGWGMQLNFGFNTRNDCPTCFQPSVWRRRMMINDVLILCPLFLNACFWRYQNKKQITPHHIFLNSPHHPRPAVWMVRSPLLLFGWCYSHIAQSHPFLERHIATCHSILLATCTSINFIDGTWIKRPSLSLAIH